MRGPACERREQLGVWGALSGGGGGGELKFLDFDPIQAILGPSGITLEHILQVAFENMGGYFFDFDLIKTILGTSGTILRHLTEYFWTFWDKCIGGGGGGVKVRGPFWAWKARGQVPWPLVSPPKTAIAPPPLNKFWKIILTSVMHFSDIFL